MNWSHSKLSLYFFVLEGQTYEKFIWKKSCSSSGIGRSGTNLAENAGSGNWLDGQRFGSGTSEEELKAWIDGLKK